MKVEQQKKDQVLYEYLRAEWIRLVGILPDPLEK
jgi:hypothetical protein